MATLNFNKSENIGTYEESVNIVAEHIHNKLTDNSEIVDYLMNKDSQGGVVAYAIYACDDSFSEYDALNLALMLDNMDDDNILRLNNNEIDLNPFVEFIDDVVEKVGVVDFTD